MATNEDMKMQAMANKVNLGNSGVGTSQQIAHNDSRMSDPTFIKESIPYTQKVIADRSSQGLDTSVQENYLARLNQGLQALQSPQGGQGGLANATDVSGYGTELTTRNTADADLVKYAEAMGENDLNSRKAALEQVKNNAILNLEKAYLNAVEDGKLTVREAQQQFLEQKATLEKEYFKQSQITAIQGNRMGIQNSAQQQALMQGDNYRANQMTNQNISQRDQRLNTIRDRISNLSLQRGMDLKNVQSDYDLGVLQATGEVNARVAGENLQTARTMSDRNWQAEMSNVGYEREKETADVKYGRDVEMMRAEFSQRLLEKDIDLQNDFAKMDKQQQQNLEAMAVQHNYSVSEARLSASLSRQGASSAQSDAIIMAMRSFGIEPTDHDALEQLRIAENKANRQNRIEQIADEKMTEQNLAVWNAGLPDKPQGQKWNSTWGSSKRVQQDDGLWYDKQALADYEKASQYYTQAGIGLGYIDAVKRAVNSGGR